MAKKYGPITVIAYAMTRDGGLVDVDTLDEERKRTLATELSIRILNEAYAKEGVKFFPADEAPVSGAAQSATG